MMVTECVLLYNPASAAGKSKKHMMLATEYLDDLGVSCEMIESQHPAHLIEMARWRAGDGIPLIACGGDGTCNEVLNGVLQSGKKTPVGFIPMGSGNDIPGALGIRPDIKRACEIIAKGTTGMADIGMATTGEGNQRFFLGIGSQGFDAAVTRKTNEGKKRFKGTWNYIMAVLKTIFKFKKREIRLRLDGEEREGRFNLVAVGNGPSYGGWMYMCPGAKIDDGLFHVTIIENLSTFKLLANFSKMYKKKHLDLPEIHDFTAKTIEIEMVDPGDEPYLAQVDGEMIGTLPVRYEVLPAAHEFIMPPTDEVLDAFKEKYARAIARGKIPCFD
ncbi:YegS/Rv2252/BmrU family lipid kinase [Candidatus Bathyarchaeota archaeon]|nr:YegS/Rv2252/BmrU family lipid kinase [Candidatus Bathyarchaeota archaeon]